MKVERGFVLANAAAILVVAALASSVLALLKAETTADELATVRQNTAEQLRVSRRVQAQVSGKLAKTDATVYGLTQAFVELKHAVEAHGSANGSAAETPKPDAPTLPEQDDVGAATDELSRKAIADAEMLVATATQAGRWTEQDRDRLHELLVEVDGRERLRIESGVGKLLVEGRLVIDGDFVPL